MKQCIFCSIIQKTIPASIVYEDTISLALLTIDPVCIGHTLVIPKKHYENIFDIDKKILAHLSLTLKKVSIDILKTHTATAVNLLNASGIDAQQSIFHFHFHVIPRHPNDGLDLWIKQKL